MLNWLKVVHRQFLRNKAVSMINIVGLAVGFASCILIMLWVQGEVNRDRNYGFDNLYRVVVSYPRGETVVKTTTTPGRLGPALENDFPEIVKSVRIALMGPSDCFRLGDKVFADRIFAVADPDIADMLPVRFLKGNWDALARDNHSVVITRDIAETYLRDKDPIGQVLQRGARYSYTIVGVMENTDPTSHLQFSFLLPPSSLVRIFQSLNTWRGEPWLATYVQLRDDTELASLGQKLRYYLADKPNQPNGVEVHLQAVESIYFDRDVKGGLAPHGEKLYVYLFSAAALLILLIAGMNFVNLSSARAMYRAREVGLRKVSGASRTGLILRFLAESILMCALAMALAVLLAELVLPAIVSTWEIQLSFGQVGLKHLIVGLSGVVVLVGVTGGIYPAVLLSSLQPARVLKGVAAGRSGGGLFRKALVVCQFVFSIIFIVGSVTIYLQVKHMHDRGLGFDREHVVYWGNKSILRAKGTTFKRELLSYSGIEHVTWCSAVPGVGTAISTREWYPEDKPGDGSTLLREIHADADFVDVFGLEVVEGQPYSDRDQISQDGKYVVLNQEAVKALRLDAPVGTRIGYKGGRDMYTIVGVVKDFHFRPLNYAIEPLAVVYDPCYSTIAYMRVREGDLASALDHIRGTIKEVYPGALQRIMFLDEQRDRIYKNEQHMGILFGAFTGLALLVSCMGLAGLSIFVVERRTREIGIRRVLGSSVSRIVLLLGSEFLKLVLVANLFAWPVAYYVTSRWLMDFAYRIEMDWRVFVLAGSLALILATVTVTVQTVRAALADPVDVLRHE
ncbi:MAG: ABC transporter permease [Candidatus Zixiibacteriota bacterium]|nr:MAG: ABC transporter permease [candidate division Zixibacteria bacterium]